MPANTEFSEAFEELKKQITNPEQYQSFLDKIDQVERKMTELHKKDRQGVMPLISEADKTELLQLHLEMGKAAEAAMSGEENAELKKKIRKLSGLASGNYNALLQYDPEKDPKSLAAVLEDVRTMTVDVRDVELEKKGAAMSSRQVMTIKDPKGKPFSGLFTPKTVVNYEADHDKIMEQASYEAETPEGALMLRNLAEDFSKKMGRILVNKKPLKSSGDPVKDLSLFYRLCGDQNGDVTKESIKTVLKILYKDPKGKMIDTYIGDKALEKMAEGMTAGFGQLVINSEDVQIKTGGRIDTRNAAMSAVADLLGVPKLLCRSKPMRIRMGNGEIVEGTFMAKGNGLDPNNLPPEVASINGRRIRISGSALKSVADLQVLDFICGNVDRHLDNLMYQLDGNNLDDVQGFDNDASFGLRTLKSGESYKRLPGTANMRVVSKSMYNKIMNIEPAELKFALRGFDLSEEELDAAVDRLNILKTDLKKGFDHYAEKEKQNALEEKDKSIEKVEGENAFYDQNMDRDAIDLEPEHIRAIEDDEWNQINTSQLLNPEKNQPKNLFDNVIHRARSLPAMAANQYKEYKELGSDTTLSTEAQELQDMPGEKAAESAELLQRLNRATNWRGSHKPFKDMCKAVEDYQKFQQKLKERMEEAQKKVKEGHYEYAMETVVNTEDLVNMEILAHKMADAAQIYTQSKAGMDLSSSPYTRNRVDLAMEVTEYALKATRHTEKEWEQARQNEQSSMDLFNRAMQNKYQAVPPQEPVQQPAPQPGAGPQAPAGPQAGM